MSTRSDEEFDGFMRGRWPAMVRLAYALTGDAGHAEDLAQAAFARAYASWDRVRRAGDPDAYVRRIVINAHRSRFRKQRVAEELRGDLADAAGAASQPGPEGRSELLGWGGNPPSLGASGSAVFGSAAPGVALVKVKLSNGTTATARPVGVGNEDLFAFPAAKSASPVRWTAYDASGKQVSSGSMLSSHGSGTGDSATATIQLTP